MILLDQCEDRADRGIYSAAIGRIANSSSPRLDPIGHVARAFPAGRFGHMRPGEQRAYCRHAAPAAGGAAETSIGPRGGTRRVEFPAFEHGKDLDIREDVTGADNHRRLAL